MSRQFSGRALRKALGQKEMAPANLARLLGLSTATVHQWVHDEGNPTTANLCAMAEALGVTPDFLCPDLPKDRNAS